MRVAEFRTGRGQHWTGHRVAPLTRTQLRYLAGARRLARFMDIRWGIGPVRFGLDSLIGLIPAWGDIVSALVSLYQMWVAVQLRMPMRKLLRMMLNIVADLLFGLVPIAGDAADVLFKAHMRNLRLIEEHVEHLERGFGTTPRRR